MSRGHCRLSPQSGLHSDTATGRSQLNRTVRPFHGHDAPPGKLRCLATQHEAVHLECPASTDNACELSHTRRFFMGRYFRYRHFCQPEASTHQMLAMPVKLRSSASRGRSSSRSTDSGSAASGRTSRSCSAGSQSPGVSSAPSARSLRDASMAASHASEAEEHRVGIVHRDPTTVQRNRLSGATFSGCTLPVCRNPNRILVPRFAVMLMNATVRGDLRHVVAPVSKSGWG
jgi:hypothetical protein